MKVAVVTPTIGSKHLRMCLNSVRYQSYGNLTHYVFIDGKEYENDVDIELLNRNNKTIWTTYNNASKKMPEAFVLEGVSIHVPIELFQDRSASPLEVVVGYLKDELGFKNHEIAKLLHRNQKTIWTTYNRKK